MKKITLFALVAAFAIMGCKKDEEKTSYNAEVTINNVKTTFTDIVFINAESGTNVSYSIYNSGDDASDITINLSNPTVGNIDFSIYNSVSLAIGTKDYYSKSGAGSFTITQIDDSVVAGNFTGTFIDENDAEVTITGNFSSKIFNILDWDM